VSLDFAAIKSDRGKFMSVTCSERKRRSFCHGVVTKKTYNSHALQEVKTIDSAKSSPFVNHFRVAGKSDIGCNSVLE
jgi:hypothetical protein